MSPARPTHPSLFSAQPRAARSPGLTDEHDACGLMAIISKQGIPSHTPIESALAGLAAMRHRAGEVRGEGDGAGLLLDIPRDWWARRLRAAGQDPAAAVSPDFVVGHFFLPSSPASLAAAIDRELAAAGLQILWEGRGQTRSEALGPAGEREEPVFYQVAARFPPGAGNPSAAAERGYQLFRAQLRLEEYHAIHTCSLSEHTVVYKVRGSPETLPRYYPELADPTLTTRAVIGHNRYSTNTTSSFARVQPFGWLGHNGEINTIAALRHQAQLLGVPLAPDGSDSQDLDRVAAFFLTELGLSLPEVMEVLFPPIPAVSAYYPPALRQLYRFYRQFWGPYAQGPAAIFARHQDALEFSVDALGLRPLWFIETSESWVFSSEPGVTPPINWVDDPHPLAPGEKMLVELGPATGRPTPGRLLRYPEIQSLVEQRAAARGWPPAGAATVATVDLLPSGGEPAPGGQGNSQWEEKRILAGAGWQLDDERWVEEIAQTGREPIHSLGYDVPLAALGRIPADLADYLKETVAVVTNPAIDREREMEHFSTTVLVGERPAGGVGFKLIELAHPLIVDPTPLLNEFAGGWVQLEMAVQSGEGWPAALERLGRQAQQAVEGGAQLLLLDDRDAVAGRAGWLDPHLALARVERLLAEPPRPPESIARATGDASLPSGAARRRQVGLVVRSASLRNLHDIMMALGLGADAVEPYALWHVARARAGAAGLAATVRVLREGIEKVLSTLGIHELRGYYRHCAAVGLPTAMLRELGCPGWASPSPRVNQWAAWEQEAERRRRLFSGQAEPELARPFHLYPKIWKSAAAVAQGIIPFVQYEEKVAAVTRADPVALRHLLEVRPPQARPASAVDAPDLSVGDHALPFVISSMSFGSQSEPAYRAYAEAAARLHIVAVSGEGGELPDLQGRFWANRGIQIASGRFGIRAEVINSARYLEIKIGQGAKPGEGGYLPGGKVTAAVAAARRATPGVDLISPSNNHDLYSIEDLAQLVYELKTVNPLAQVIVKVPVVPGIGTIAVGIAKAGADIINLSGFDGGTGAARAHSLRHVGLPVEIGVREAHRALQQAGLRQQVELWCDGGLKSAADVLVMVLLGANRVGFGTLAMVAMGCTICRGCHLDTCHVGITTQIRTVADAQARGLKRFVPRQVDVATAQLTRFFQGMGEELARRLAAMGVDRLQDLVGRVDWLVQVQGEDRLSWHDLLTPSPSPALQLQAHGLPVHESSATVTETVTESSKDSPTERPTEPVAERSAEPWLMRDDQGVWVGRRVGSPARAVGTRWAGWRVRRPERTPGETGRFRLTEGSVPGNGLAAFNVAGEEIWVDGSGSDGVGKLSSGGRVVIFKVRNRWGRWVGGAVGKSFAYGAQSGLFWVQGEADARACIRLSGADVVLGGLAREPVPEEPGLGLQSNLKGFAFEYMTAGRAVVLGDPGPWICAGMTGGRVYLHLWPERGLTRPALEKRLARGARVRLEDLDEAGALDVQQLLSGYVVALRQTGQGEEAQWVEEWTRHPREHFLQVVPVRTQVDASVTTE